MLFLWLCNIYISLVPGCIKSQDRLITTRLTGLVFNPQISWLGLLLKYITPKPRPKQKYWLCYFNDIFGLSCTNAFLILIKSFHIVKLLFVLAMLLRPKFGSNTMHTFTTEWTAMVVAHCILLHRICYMSISASLTQPKADTNSTIWNDLIYILTMHLCKYM